MDRREQQAERGARRILARGEGGLCEGACRTLGVRVDDGCGGGEQHPRGEGCRPLYPV